MAECYFSRFNFKYVLFSSSWLISMNDTIWTALQKISRERIDTRSETIVSLDIHLCNGHVCQARHNGLVKMELNSSKAVPKSDDSGDDSMFRFALKPSAESCQNRPPLMITWHRRLLDHHCSTCIMSKFTWSSFPYDRPPDSASGAVPYCATGEGRWCGHRSNSL